MVLLVYLVVFLAFTGHSSATYCLCKDGVSEQMLQKALDYACGAGADCSPINQNGPCFNPNTVKDHCNYAVNSYFQKKGQAQGSCDFSGTASVSSNPPPNVPSSCSFPSSGSSSTPTTELRRPNSDDRNSDNTDQWCSFDNADHGDSNNTDNRNNQRDPFNNPYHWDKHRDTGVRRRNHLAWSVGDNHGHHRSKSCCICLHRQHCLHFGHQPLGSSSSC
ncbi:PLASMODESMATA CALLOSE-BINDING PROTEIN 4 [Hibiscus syriacus]|uniref:PLASMODESMATA CALLOSE-BINDING PROTEIN 4 n=1 Tax=Hibiscus syriacus TaxID=106335 RepID=A0A6A3AST5_HIBSY|nr:PLASMODESMATA CALLOSE-BINDING PROTEIN 3-like [Hibiscus syriacus]KAE8707336.1 PLASMODESMATA CALLOSE-BINDING PROTEIN 4 [Hibiscus syriacus]